MGTSRASKDYIYNKMGKSKFASIPSRIVNKVKNYLTENQKLNQMAVEEMDKKYPAGWSQNSLHISELQQIKKKLRNK